MVPFFISLFDVNPNFVLGHIIHIQLFVIL
jgi:hypothetical protein